MNLSFFTALQKLRYFLATTFPALARSLWPQRTIERLAARYPTAAAWVVRTRQSLLGGHVEKAAGVFAVGEYHADVLDWAKLPREAVPLLRGGVVVAGLLCLLLPLAISLDWPPIAIEQILEIPDRGTVGAWDIGLWVVAMSLGWAALLTGAGIANRAVFLLALASFLYLNLANLSALPKSYWTLLLPLQGVVATVFTLTRHRAGTRNDTVVGLVTALLAASACGFVASISIPTAPWFRGRIPLAIAVVGIPLGGMVWGLGRLLVRRGVVWHLAWSVAGLAALGIASYTSLAARGGWHLPAAGVAQVGTMMTSYLWPLYYFIGVGVVFKVLRQARTLQRAARELVPHALAVPLTIAALVVASAVLWAPSVGLTPGLPWPRWLVSAADLLASAFPFTWSTSVGQRTTETMRWVVLALGLASVWASHQGRLNARAVARTQVLVLVTWFAITEYHVEMQGIARAPRVSAVALLLFSVFVLWIMHRTMLRFVTGDSAAWPGTSRAPLYVAALMFVLLPTHARGAMHDPRLSSEIVYYLFQGVLVFGVPYYMFIYATRRFALLPLTPVAALAVFLCGGVGAALLVALDRVVVAGSLGEAWAYATQQVADGIAGRRDVPRPVVLPPWWIVLRSTLVVAVMMLTMRVVRRRTRILMMRPAATVFAVMAFAAGLACFANRPLELPLLPARVGMMVTPLRFSLWVDEAYLAVQLSYLLPSLVLAWAASFERSLRRSLGAMATAAALHVVIQAGWPGAEAWLRSTGVVAMVAAGGVGAFLLLASAIRDRLDDLLTRKPDAETSDEGLSDHLLTRAEVRRVALAVCLVAAAVAAGRVWSARPETRRLAAGSGSAQLPATWRSDSAAWIRPDISGDTSRLVVELRPDTLDAMAALQELAPTLGEQYPAFTPTGLHRWDHVATGMVALDFTWYQQPADSSTYRLGTVVLTPVGGDHLGVGTLTYGPALVDRRWDVARMLASLRPAGR
ncbi:MAG: hypothetical protein IPK85_14115 [Gemmatimonadetes bacterium]|nr:hypothetical protein [Gemmatimonadota bacterium]